MKRKGKGSFGFFSEMITSGRFPCLKSGVINRRMSAFTLMPLQIKVGEDFFAGVFSKRKCSKSMESSKYKVGKPCFRPLSAMWCEAHKIKSASAANFSNSDLILKAG